MYKKFHICLMLILLCFVTGLVGCSGLGSGDQNSQSNTSKNIEIYFEEGDHKLELGDTCQLVVKFRDENATDKTITWQSENPSIASVDENGLVTTLDVGNVSIIATSSTGYTASCYIVVGIYPTSISLDKTKIELFEGEFGEVSATILPDNCTDTYIEWVSSNEDVAFVNYVGDIYADNAGTTTITAKTINGLTASIVVTVKPYIKVSSVVLNYSEYNAIIPYNDNYVNVSLSATVYPANASYPELVWSSTNESIATVDDMGNVNVIKAGTVYIDASTKDNIKARCRIVSKKEVIASSINITNSRLSLIEGNPGVTLSVSWSPYNTTYKDLSWHSSNESVATVSSSGKVMPIGVGEAIITATSRYGKTDTCAVTVNPRVYADSVTLDKTTITIEETKSDTLVATVMPDNTTDKSITWSSRNTSIATVDSSGVVTGISAGTTTIVATTVNGKTAECEVVVEELKIRISVVINGEITDTLLTCRSQEYKVDLPDKPEDITTNRLNTTYFYGWFADEECSEYLSNKEQIFESDSAIYARKIVVNDSNFSLDVSDPSGVIITKFNNTSAQDIVVVPNVIRGYSIHSIKAHAFNADSTIKTIVLPRYIPLINNNAINNCSQLEQILIYENSPTFTTKTINYCSSVQYNTYGGLKYLGNLDNPYMIAMGVDGNVKSVSLSKDCCNINTVLDGMNGLVSISVDDGNEYYSAKNGILYNKAETEIVCVPNKLAGDIIIPSSITNIAEDLFKNRSITSVDLGGNVRKINAYAFSNCRSLATVTGTDNLEEIGNYVFNNTRVSNFEFCNKLKTIGQYAFGYCDFTTLNIPSSVQVIDACAFYNCSNITEITLPFVGRSYDALDADNRYPFGYIFSHEYNTSAFTKISQSYLLSGRNAQVDYYIPLSLNKITITGGEIFYGAFSGCKNISITICDGIQIVQDYAFKDAELTSLTLPKTITSIGNYASSNSSIDNLYYDGDIEDWCSISFVSVKSNPAEGATNIYFENNAVTEIVIPNSITEIKDYVFIGFKNVTDVVLHSNITSIGDYAFKCCSSLEEIEIPTKITELNNNVFENCSALQSVILNNGLEILGYSVFKDCSSLLTIEMPSTITALGGKLFSGCTSLNDVMLSNNIDCIPSNTFENCISLESIDIPNNVANIYSEAFKNCTSLQSLEIYNEDVVIDAGIIAGCSGLQSLVIPYIGSHGTGTMKNYFAHYFGTDSFDNSIQLELSSKTYYIPLSLKTLEIIGGTLYGNALGNCTNLETIIIGENVVELKENALYNCANLKSLIINARALANSSGSPIALIGTNTDGTTITFGDTVGNIPSNLMKAYVEEDTIPNISNIVIAQDGELASIGDYAFAYCQDLSEITIPSSVTSIGNKAFYKCARLTNIVVADNNSNYSSINGNLYNKLGTAIIQYAIGKTNTSFEITNTVTSITAYAFDGAINLNKIIYNTNNVADMTSGNYIFEGIGDASGFDVVIGAEVVKIPNYLFNISDSVGANVKSLTFDNNSQCTTIGSNAFAYCSLLTDVQLTNSVNSIGANAFYSCENISTVEFSGSVDNYVQIGYVDIYANPMLYADSFTINGDELSDLVLSNAVNEIADYALYNHSNIETITWSENITSIGANAFYNCNNIQNMIIPNKVTTIGRGAFNNCAGIKKIYLPIGVTSVSSGLLYGCSNIEEITIPFVGRSKMETPSKYALFGYIFGETAFDNALTTPQYYNLGENNASPVYYYIPRSITVVTVLDGIINNGAFSYCKNIVTVNYGDGVKSIGDYAYYNCEKLSQVNFNENITTIGTCAFRNCVSLNTVTIGDGVTTIGNSAFQGCEYIANIEFGDSVTSIGDYAFYNCSAIAKLDLPNSLQSIGQYAFYNCIKFLSVTLGENMKTIGEHAFEGCLKLVEVFDYSSQMAFVKGDKGCGYVAYYALVVHTSKTATSVLENIDGYLFVNDVNNTYLISCERDDEDLVLPTKECNYSINAYAFSYMPNLRTVVLPNSVNSISNNAFYKCTKLTEFTVTKSVTNFPMNFIFGCGTLSRFNYIGSVEDWLNLDFTSEHNNPLRMANRITINSEEITEYTIPEGTTIIKPFAFYKFDSLVEITIPASVIEIGAGAFKNCTHLQSVNIPTVGLENVGEFVFEDCSSLRSFTIPYTLEKISSGMFSGCELLGNMNIPSNIKRIESCAFENCKSITVMTIPSTVNYISIGILGGCESLQKLTIPRLQYSTDGVGFVLGVLFSDSIGGERFNAITQARNSEESKVYYIPKTLTSVLIQSGEIVYGALHGCANIVTLSNGVSKVNKDAIIVTDEGVGMVDGIYYKDNWAMSSISKLTNVILKSGTVGIADGAFEGVSITNGVTTVNTLKYIGDRAFKNTSIKTISTYENLIRIGDESFYNCVNLTSISIPSTVKSIGDRALYGCSYLSAINVDSDNTEYISIDGNLYDVNVTKLIKYAAGKSDTTFSMPNTVLTIEEYAFMNAKNITDVTFSTKLQYVNEGAFYGCEKLRYAILPIAVKYVGDYAFYGCSNLTGVTIDIAVLEIGAYAFAECSKLEDSSTGVTFLDATGWVVQSSPVEQLEESNLKNVRTAAYYLVVKHYKYAWKKL